MQTGLWKVHNAGVASFTDNLSAFWRDFKTVDAVEKRTRNILAIGMLVRQRTAVAASVPFLATDYTGMTADTHIKVDHQPEFFRGTILGKAGHFGDHSCP
jgi:hypothetical protein